MKEIFGQDVPVQRQNAYRHMIITVLRRESERFRRSVMELKEARLKTEPASGSTESLMRLYLGVLR